MTHLQACFLNIFKASSLLILLHYPAMVTCECTCEVEDLEHGKGEALKFKLGSILSILVAGAIGISLPLLGKKIKAFRPENDIFFMIKAFAAGVILATGFIHILPDAFKSLTSPCLSQNLWGRFPFTGFVAMMSAIGTLMVDSFASGFYKRMHFKESKTANNTDEETAEEHEAKILALSELVRRRIISQVLELGIVVHSIIIGISLGASQSPETIKPLMAALSFHQFFEGLGLGGCITQAQFESASMVMMATFFSLTTPVGIAIGIGICSIYSENRPTALIVEGIFNGASAGILIYMALVDLLASDFMSPRMQSNFRIQLGANVSLLLGAGCMTFMVKWA
ncbi:hypothetical protein OIU84_020931 [Salix udensis]|uniref:Uncharacterized protein n=1 Tax=Salix udensis TaxID=889485 RepID=A0AAD6KTQ6_9ROSI|nr:hypothetical protein OIU84_020931 [Salix udensis]